MELTNCRNYTQVEYIRTNNGYEEFPDYCSIYCDNKCYNHLDCYFRKLEETLNKNYGLEERLTIQKVEFEEELEHKQRLIDSIKELANENINTLQYKGICESILNILRSNNG